MKDETYEYLKGLSKKNITIPINENTTENITTSCLMRIADSLEQIQISLRRADFESAYRAEQLKVKEWKRINSKLRKELRELENKTLI